MDIYPHFKDVSAFDHSIKSRLSKDKCFQKTVRQTLIPNKGSGNSKFLWTMNEECECQKCTGCPRVMLHQLKRTFQQVPDMQPPQPRTHLTPGMGQSFASSLPQASLFPPSRTYGIQPQPMPLNLSVRGPQKPAPAQYRHDGQDHTYS